MSTATPEGPRRDAADRRSVPRLKMVTLGAVVIVGLAGGVAVAANIGILDSSDDTGVGSLSATADLTPSTQAPSTQVVDVYVADSTTSAPVTLPADGATTVPPAAPAGQVFTVDVAGTVTISELSGTLQATAVAPAPGWTWQLEPATAADQVTVTFTNGARTLHFVAARAADGTIAGRVDEPIVQTPAASPGGGSGGYEGDDDEHEGGEHEGGGDDD